MRNDLKELLQLLLDGEYHTVSELAEKLGISPKTARARMKEADEAGKKYGVSIGSKPRYGFILKEEEQDGIQRMMDAKEEETALPDSREERTNYLLIYLLNHADYTKIEDLCEFLCVARSTLQTSLKEAEEILRQYHITLDRRPNYGICAKGSEFNIRRCVGECFVKRNIQIGSTSLYSAEEVKKLAQMLLRITGEHKVYLPENVLENLVIQIYVALKRIKRGCCVQFGNESDGGKYQVEYQIAEVLAGELEEWQKTKYTPEEIRYIVIYLAGVRSLGSLENDRGNFVIREELDRLVLKMLDLIYDEFRIEFRNNFNLRMSLNQHMVPFDIRMRYQIEIANPILDEIKKNYVFGFTMARRGCIVLEKHYGHEISEEEAGFFAMLFIFALEQKDREIDKSRILIVCSAGRGSSQLLRYKYEKEFGKYLEKMYVCGLYELETFDFGKIDYIFTTVPIRKRVPVPITEVGQFLGRADILRVRKVLEKGHMDFLDDYYREEQFLTEIKGETKEEVILNICEKIGEQRKLPEGFYEAVLKREELAQTDFGNYIAMPHPYEIMTEDTFVYVAVLKKEILWNRYPVQLVFLSAISGKEDKNLPKYYEVTTSLFLQEDMVRIIIREKKFDVLMQMLRQIYYTD